MCRIDARLTQWKAQKGKMNKNKKRNRKVKRIQNDGLRPKNTTTKKERTYTHKGFVVNEPPNCKDLHYKQQ